MEFVNPLVMNFNSDLLYLVRADSVTILRCKLVIAAIKSINPIRNTLSCRIGEKFLQQGVRAVAALMLIPSRPFGYDQV